MYRTQEQINLDISDILKRLHVLENCLLTLTGTIDENKINYARFKNLELKVLKKENNLIEDELRALKLSAPED